MYINAWYLLVNSLAHLEVSESWVKTHTLIQTILETCILVITKSPWGVLGFSVAWGRGDGFNPVETCLVASWICSQMCCRDEKNFTRFLIQCFIQFHLFLLWTSITILFWFVSSCTVAWNVYLHIQSSQSILFNTFFLLNLFLPNASSCWSPTRLPRNWPHSGMQRYRALKSARLTMLWPTWGGEIDESHRPIFAPT